MKFGEILRNLIGEREITQRKLAADLNIAPSTLGNYIQDSREPDFQTLKDIANYFGVTVDYLIGNPDPVAKSKKEEELLRIFRALSPQQRELYIEQGKAFIRVNIREKERLSKSGDKKGNSAG